jgi:hypothetical protein
MPMSPAPRGPIGLACSSRSSSAMASVPPQELVPDEPPATDADGTDLDEVAPGRVVGDARAVAGHGHRGVHRRRHTGAGQPFALGARLPCRPVEVVGAGAAAVDEATIGPWAAGLGIDVGLTTDAQLDRTCRGTRRARIQNGTALRCSDAEWVEAKPRAAPAVEWHVGVSFTTDPERRRRVREDHRSMVASYRARNAEVVIAITLRHINDTAEVAASALREAVPEGDVTLARARSSEPIGERTPKCRATLMLRNSSQRCALKCVVRLAVPPRTRGHSSGAVCSTARLARNRSPLRHHWFRAGPSAFSALQIASLPPGVLTTNAPPGPETFHAS